LVNNVAAREYGPVLACLGNSRRNVHLLDIRRPLKNVDIETRADVPGNVAMKRPDTWVICLELNNSVGRAGARPGLAEDLDVAASWVLRVGDSTIPDPYAL